MTPAASTAAGRRAPSPVGPRGARRVSGPVAGGLAQRPAERVGRPAPRQRLSLVRPVVARMRALPDASLIDRLIRGRAWIPVLGVMLAGIVFSQVEILKLGSSMGHWVDRSSTLSARNEQLRASVAGLADDQRIESLAAGMGMVIAQPASLGFLSARHASPAAALAQVRPPDTAQFLASLPAQTPAAATPTVSTTTQTAVAGSGASTSTSSQSGSQATSTPTGASSTGAGASTGQSSSTAQSTPSTGQSAAAGSQSAGSTGATPAAGVPAAASGAAPGGAAIAPPASSSASSGG